MADRVYVSVWVTLHYPMQLSIDGSSISFILTVDRPLEICPLPLFLLVIQFFLCSDSGYYLGASLVAQMVKNLPAMQETQV